MKYHFCDLTLKPLGVASLMFIHYQCFHSNLELRPVILVSEWTRPARVRPASVRSCDLTLHFLGLSVHRLALADIPYLSLWLFFDLDQLTNGLKNDLELPLIFLFKSIEFPRKIFMR